MILKIKVQPNSGRQEIIKISEEEYKVFLTKSPENNKANEQLIKLLKKHFALKRDSPRDLKIIKGRTSRNKIIEVN